MKVATEAGYNLTLEDLAEVEEENRKAIAARTDRAAEELSDDQMDKVAGGVLWFYDDAEDGHEDTCLLTWYGKYNVFTCAAIP